VIECTKQIRCGGLGKPAKDAGDLEQVNTMFILLKLPLQCSAINRLTHLAHVLSCLHVQEGEEGEDVEEGDENALAKHFPAFLWVLRVRLAFASVSPHMFQLFIVCVHLLVRTHM
jgi:hypothetical protein